MSNANYHRRNVQGEEKSTSKSAQFSISSSMCVRACVRTCVKQVVIYCTVLYEQMCAAHQTEQRLLASPTLLLLLHRSLTCSIIGCFTALCTAICSISLHKFGNFWVDQVDGFILSYCHEVKYSAVVWSLFERHRRPADKSRRNVLYNGKNGDNYFSGRF